MPPTIADLVPALAHALAPASPLNGGDRVRGCARTPASDAYVRDVVKLFRIWHCDKWIRDEVFKVILHHRNVTFCVGVSAGDPIAIMAAFDLTATMMCLGLFLGGDLEQGHMLEAHTWAVHLPNPTDVKHLVALHPQLGLDVCDITPYSGYWTLLQDAPKRKRNGDILPSPKRPVLATNINKARSVAHTWVGENTDPVHPISFLQVLGMLRMGRVRA